MIVQSEEDHRTRVIDERPTGAATAPPVVVPREALIEHVRATDPIQVATDHRELALVRGLPEEALRHMRSGDALMGWWKAGHFHACAWYPAAFLPAVQGAEEEAEGG